MSQTTWWRSTTATCALAMLVGQGAGTAAAEPHGLAARVQVLEQNVRTLQSQQAVTQQALTSIQNTLDTLVAGTPAVGAWAVVDSTGTLARGANVKTVTLNTQGTTYYVVQFTRKVDQCAALVSSGFSGVDLLGFPFISGDIVHVMPWTDDSVLVWIVEPAGVAQGPFHLAMIC